MFNPFAHPEIPEITAEAVSKTLSLEKNVILLDVRTPEEYKKGHIKGSLSLPMDELVQKITTVVPDKTQTIYVYCFSGSRSAPVVKQLLEMGYKHVFNMTHGILAWRQKGYPLV